MVGPGFSLQRASSPLFEIVAVPWEPWSASLTSRHAGSKAGIWSLDILTGTFEPPFRLPNCPAIFQRGAGFNLQRASSPLEAD